MLELKVYYYDVLRFTIVANWAKVQELRNKGFTVQVKEIPGQGFRSGGRSSPRSLQINARSDLMVHHDDESGAHKLAEVQRVAEHHTLGFY